MPGASSLLARLVNAATDPVQPGSLAHVAGSKLLAAAITAAYAAYGYTVHVILFARLANLFLDVNGDVSLCTNFGTEGDAVQAVAGKRFKWNPTGINGLGSLDSADTIRALRVPPFDATAATAVVTHTLFQDSDVASRYVCEYGVLAVGNEGWLIRTNSPLDTIAAVAFDAGQPEGKSAAAYPMTNPAVVTGTWDSTLAAAEVKIRHDGLDVTDIPSVGNTAGLFAANYAYVMGARWNEGSGVTGSHGVHVLASGAAPIPLVAVAEVDALIKSGWGL